MKNPDTAKHVKGESIFVNDFTPPEGTLYAYIYESTIAHGKILSIDFSEAEKLNGVEGILTSRDIPGVNQIGGMVKDETLLAEGSVEYIGEPIAIVIADKYETARKASNLIKIEFEKLPAITNPREAYKNGDLIIPPRIFSSGDIEKAWDLCDVIVEGVAESGGQEHLYLETQSALAVPTEGGGIKLYSSTQSPTAVQRATAGLLGLAMHKVEVDVLRLGGAFGGKEDQATPFAAMCSLAAFKLNRPVKLVLSRLQDLRMTGKRHPYSSDYKIGLTEEGKILAYEVTYFQNAGACADLSPAILDRSLFHTTNSYFIPNVKATGISCRTNLPPNTAFRGFGGPQGMFVIEAAIFKAAEKLNMLPAEIQKINLLKENDQFYFGQKALNVNAEKCWQSANDKYNLDQILIDVDKFNSENDQYKKGVAVMPLCFGISFTSTFMNQASALAHIYSDGSVGVSTAAIEMGQGVNQKLITIAAEVLSINSEHVKIESTNTTRNANTSPTAASTGADLNGNALIIALGNIKERLIDFAAEKFNTKSKYVEVKNEWLYINNEKTDWNWEKLINQAFFNRINLSSHAFYATPGLSFDTKTNQGNPFAYHVYGTGIVTTTVDCLRGTYEFDSIKVVHDFGKSLDLLVDRGQAEGAIVQGIGWVTVEELAQADDGRLLSNTLSTYKIPDIYSIPKEIEIDFLEDSENHLGPFKSKAIGEPPFMYGIAAYFAIINAIKAFRPDKEIEMSAPITPEKVLLSLYK